MAGSEPPQPPEGIDNQRPTQPHDEQTKSQPQVRAGELISERRADPAANEQRRRDNKGSPEIDIAMPLVFDCRRQSDGRKQHGEARARGQVLRKTGEVHKAGDDQNTPAQAEEAGGDTRSQPDRNEQKNGSFRIHSITRLN